MNPADNQLQKEGVGIPLIDKAPVTPSVFNPEVEAMTDDQANQPAYRWVLVGDIKPMPEVQRLLPSDSGLIEEISGLIRAERYDPDKPIVVWGDEIVDGNTRYFAAIKAGLTHVPVVDRHFSDRHSALIYAVSRQVFRRSLTDAQIVVLIEEFDQLRPLGGPRKSGSSTSVVTNVTVARSSERTAQALGTGRRTVEAVRQLKAHNPEALDAVRRSEISIHKAQRQLAARKTAATSAEPVSTEGGGPGNTADETPQPATTPSQRTCDYDKVLELLRQAGEAAKHDEHLDGLLAPAIIHVRKTIAKIARKRAQQTA